MKNFEFAQEHESKIKEKYILSANSSVENNYVDILFNKYIVIVPKLEENHIVTLDLSSNLPDDIKGVSKKISNVSLNLKSAIALAIELAISADVPESITDYIKISIKILVELYCLSCINLNDKVCLLLLYLHNKNVYKKGISEQQIFEDISAGAINITKNEYLGAISQLDKMSIITINEGIINLKEKITLRY